MKTTTTIAALALLAAALSALPSAQAAPPIYCVMAPCGPSEPLPDRLCAASERELAPGVWLYSEGDCSQRIDVKLYDCVWNCGWVTYVQGPPLTVRVYQQTDGASSSEAEIPSPCGPTALCEGPSCPPAEVSTRDVFAYLGPHASVAIDGSCNVTVTERGLQCSFGTASIDRSAGPVTVGADVCLPSLDCTCDPLPVKLD